MHKSDARARGRERRDGHKREQKGRNGRCHDRDDAYLLIGTFYIAPTDSALGFEGNGLLVNHALPARLCHRARDSYYSRLGVFQRLGGYVVHDW